MVFSRFSAFMRATRAHGFLPFKASLLCRSNDDIKAFSPENRRVPATVFGKGRFFFACFPFLPRVHINKNNMPKAKNENKFLPISNSRGQFSVHTPPS